MQHYASLRFEKKLAGLAAAVAKADGCQRREGAVRRGAAAALGDDIDCTSGRMAINVLGSERLECKWLADDLGGHGGE